MSMRWLAEDDFIIMAVIGKIQVCGNYDKTAW